MDSSRPSAAPATTLRDPLPPVNYLVDPLITAGSRVMVYAEWASYKTFLLLHLALHLAAGRE